MRYNKFHVAKKIERTIDGIVFASKAEAIRYRELKLLECAGKIKDLHLQPRFLLIPKTKTQSACYYVADFQYIQNKKIIVEDVKGFVTAVYKLKKKLFLYLYGEQYTFFENKV